MAASGLLSTAVDTTSNLNQPLNLTGAVAPSLNDTTIPTTPPPVVAAPTNSTPANVASVPAAPTVQPRTIAQNETVSGQLNQLLAGDSKYIQSAQNRAMETANSRGLINSSIAAGAGERAAIDAALPIATSDAATNANAAQLAQQGNQDLGLTTHKSLLDSAQQASNFDYNTQLNSQNIAGNMAIGKQAQDAALVLKGLDISQSDKNSLSNSISPIIQQVQAEISNIQRTPDSVMNAAAKQKAIDFQNQLLQAQLKTISSLYGYSIDWAVPNNAGTGTVGQPNTGTVTTPNNQITGATSVTSAARPTIPPTGATSGSWVQSGTSGGTPMNPGTPVWQWISG